jgi:hypothetical protein
MSLIAVILNDEEIGLLKATPLNSIQSKHVQRIFYELILILDEETGRIEIPLEKINQMRSFVQQYNDPFIKKLFLSIFERTLGKDLDLGFFD